MKINFYMLATIVLLLFIITFFIFGNSNEEVTTSHSSAVEDLGEYQKAVLSIKNANYYPSVLEVKAGKPLRIYLDNSVQGCYRSLVIPSLNIQQSITSNEDYVEINLEAGTYNFECSMGMGKGKIIVS